MIYDRWVIVLLCFYEYLAFIFLVNLLLHEDAVQFLNFRQEGKKRIWEFKGLHDAFSEILTLVQKSGGTFDLTWRVLQQALIICTVNRRGEACTCKVWHVGVPGFWSPPAVYGTILAPPVLRSQLINSYFLMFLMTVGPDSGQYKSMQVSYYKYININHNRNCIYKWVDY